MKHPLLWTVKSLAMQPNMSNANPSQVDVRPSSWYAADHHHCQVGVITTHRGLHRRDPFDPPRRPTTVEYFKGSHNGYKCPSTARHTTRAAQAPARGPGPCHPPPGSAAAPHGTSPPLPATATPTPSARAYHSPTPTPSSRGARSRRPRCPAHRLSRAGGGPPRRARRSTRTRSSSRTDSAPVTSTRATRPSIPAGLEACTTRR